MPNKRKTIITVVGACSACLVGVTVFSQDWTAGNSGRDVPAETVYVSPETDESSTISADFETVEDMDTLLRSGFMNRSGSNQETYTDHTTKPSSYIRQTDVIKLQNALPANHGTLEDTTEENGIMEDTWLEAVEEENVEESFSEEENVPTETESYTDTEEVAAEVESTISDVAEETTASSEVSSTLAQTETTASETTNGQTADTEITDTPTSETQPTEAAPSETSSETTVPTSAQPTEDTYVYIDGLKPMTQEEYRVYQIIENNYLLGSVEQEGSWGYYAGWCVWYAYNARYIIGRPVPNDLGNAETWAYWAGQEGLNVTSVPTVGSVACDSTGNHVMFVEKVYADGSLLISEGAYNYQPFNYRQRYVSAEEASMYLYIE